MSLNASREAVGTALSDLGYKIMRSWHFQARSTDDTPSAYIYPDGIIHDFGGGGCFHGDLADFLCEFHNKGKGEALKEARRLLELPENINFDSYDKAIDKKEGFISERWISNFEMERKHYFKRYIELLDEAMPALTRPEQRTIAQKYKIGYSQMADRLIMPIRDEEGRCVTLWKYNKHPKPYFDEKRQVMVEDPPKVRFTKGRERVPFNLQDLKKYGEDKNGWILLCEGEKDCLNALGKGYRAITLGGAGERIDAKDLHLFEGLKIIIVYDYDEAGYVGVHGFTNKQKQYIPGVLAQLQPISQEVKVWDWELLALQEGFELCKGFDFTDWLCAKEIKEGD